MLMFRNEQLTIKPGFYISTATFLLLLPFKWVGAWLVAAAFHELCHYTALKICRISVFSVTIGFSGTVIETGTMSRTTETVCALAGPIGGFLLLLLSRWFPRVAICAFVQSAYNLLPVYPLDGGRALQCFLLHIFDEKKALLICRFNEYLLFAVLLTLAVFATFKLELGPIPIIFVVLLFLKNRQIKFPCKQRKQIVQ